MKFLHYDLGRLEANQVVQITLTGNTANVRLLDAYNFQNYRRGSRYHFYGGIPRQSPFNIGVPESNHWHVVIDMQGLAGQTNAAVRVIS